MAQIDFRNKEALLSQFDAMATPFFEVTGENKRRKFQFVIDDIEEAKKYLETQLLAIEFSKVTTVYTIIYYSEVSDKGRLINDSVIGSNTFKLSEGELSTYRIMGGGSDDLREIKEMLIAQQSQINALSMDQEEEEEESEAIGGASGFIGMIQPLLSNPEIQRAIAGKIIGFINKIIPDNNEKNYPMNNNTALAGLTQDDLQKINSACEVLLAAGMSANDFEKLASLTKDPAQFQFYLSMLRK